VKTIQHFPRIEGGKRGLANILVKVINFGGSINGVGRKRGGSSSAIFAVRHACYAQNAISTSDGIKIILCNERSGKSEF